MKKILFMLICLFSVSLLYANVNKSISDYVDTGPFQVMEDVATVSTETIILKNSFTGELVFTSNDSSLPTVNGILHRAAESLHVYHIIALDKYTRYLTAKSETFHTLRGEFSPDIVA